MLRYSLWENLSLASELNWRRTGLGLVGRRFSLERDVDTFVGDAEKGGINEDVSVIIC